VMIDGVVHWVAQDVCDRLGYENSRDAYSTHCKGVAIRYPLQTAGGMQQMHVLVEGDVFRLTPLPDPVPVDHHRARAGPSLPPEPLPRLKRGVPQLRQGSAGSPTWGATVRNERLILAQ
jgi:hypothetical protein